MRASLLAHSLCKVAFATTKTARVMHAVFYTKPRAFCTCEQGTPGGGPELPCGWGGMGRQYDAAAGLPPSDGVGGRGAPVPRCRRAAAAGRLPPLINCRNGQGGRRPLRAPLAKAPSESNQYCERGGGLATPPCPRQERRRPAPDRRERWLRARTRSGLESEVWCGGYVRPGELRGGCLQALGWSLGGAGVKEGKCCDSDFPGLRVRRQGLRR